MKHERNIIGKLDIVNKLPNSHLGNPRYEVSIGDERFTTQTNAGLAYGITQYRGKLVKAKVGYYYGSPSVELVELISQEDQQ